MTRKKDDYEIGYRKPPAHSRFRAGRSGNPKGRPKKERLGLRALLDRLLYETVPVQLNGRTQNIPLIEVIVRNTLRAAASGKDRRALSDFLRLRAHALAVADAMEGQPRSERLTEADIKLLGELGELYGKP
jgi:hypothetical protein